MDKRFLNTKELAQYLNLSEPTIRFWVRLGRIPFVKFGRAVRFDVKKIEVWVSKKEANSRREFHLENEKHLI